MADATLVSLLGDQLQLHYDAADAGSLFTDTSGTTPASNGDTVKCWKPQSDAALQVNLTESTNGPAYRSDYASSGYPAVEFDGTNDVLLNTSTGFPGGSREFIIAVYTFISGITIWSRGNGSAWTRGYASAPSLQSSVGITLAAGSLSGRTCAAWCFGSGQTQVDALGVCNGTQSNGVPSGLSAAVALGALNTGSLSQHGAVAINEFLLIGATVDWPVVLQATKLLRTKWGISDPNGTPQIVSGGAVDPLGSLAL